MITRTELACLWSQITPQHGQNVGRRADPQHPLDFFITYDEDNNMQFMLVAEHQTSIPESSRQIYVRGNKRADGKFAVCFSLEDERLKDQYISLCWDIMECTNGIRDQKIGVQTAVKRFTLWQKLFAENRTKQLSEAEVKGLIGELAVLRNICIQRYGIDDAVAGWVGPLGADRDFEYSDIWLESKFVSLSMDKVSISSIDQLDVDRTGYLILYRAEKTAAAAPESVTLNRLTDEISALARSNENTLVSFMNRLALTRYDPSDERSDQPYMIHRYESYWVDEDFPRIRRSNIPDAISDGEYKLSIPALQQWNKEIN